MNLDKEIHALEESAKTAYVKASNGQMILKENLEQYEGLIALQEYMKDNATVLEQLCQLAEKVGKDPVESFSSFALAHNDDTQERQEVATVEVSDAPVVEESHDDLLEKRQQLTSTLKKVLEEKGKEVIEEIKRDSRASENEGVIIPVKDVTVPFAVEGEIPAEENELLEQGIQGIADYEAPVISTVSNVESSEALEEGSLEITSPSSVETVDPHEVAAPAESITSESVSQSTQETETHEPEKISVQDQVSPLIRKYFAGDTNLTAEEIAILDSLEKGDLSNDPRISGTRELLLEWAGRKHLNSLQKLGRKVVSMKKFDWKGNLNAKKLEIIRALFTLDNKHDHSQNYKDINLQIANFRLNQKNKSSDILIRELEVIEHTIDGNATTMSSSEKRKLYSKLSKLGRIIDRKKRQENSLAQENDYVR